MRFGGHETFAIREGWLHKGLKLLVESPDKLNGVDAADWLGVGKNMGKSIKHWLMATGLAVHSGGSQRETQLEVTKLGKLIYQRDRYFLHPGTWWAIHIELVNCEEYAVTWWWFFNRFTLTRFDRATCLTNLRAFLDAGSQRVPAQKTLQRDISCLIATYATALPREVTDPEEADDCPLKELSLLTYSRATGACSSVTGMKSVPAELLGYALAKSLFIVGGQKRQVDVTLREAASKDGGPGKAFVMNSDALFELGLQAEAVLGSAEFAVSGLGAERTFRVMQRSTKDWLAMYYDRVREQKHAA